MPDAAERPQSVVGCDGAKAAERGDEDAEHSRAEEARPPVIEVVVEAAVEMLEDLAKEQRNHQKEETDRGNREKDGERVQGQEVHVCECAHSR